ncbi:hypothetical protein Tco_0184063 [Tanacetum coccineum]
MIDYSLWEVIDNGNAPLITKVIEGVETTIAPKTIEEKYLTRKSTRKNVNQKFLKSLSPEWNTHTIVWRNKPEIDTLSLDDLYNNLKIYEPKVKGISSLSTNRQNVAFVSLNSTSSTNGVVNTAHGATTASTQATAINSTKTDNLSDVVIWLQGTKKTRIGRTQEGLCQWRQLVIMLWCLGDCFLDMIRVIKQIEGPTNFALMAYSSASSNSKVSTDSNYSSYCLENVKILKEQNEKLLKDLRTSKLNVIAYKTSLESVEARLLIVDKYKIGLGYNAVPPPYTGNFMPPKPDLSFSGLEEFTSEPIVTKPVVETSEAKASTDKPKAVRKNNGTPIIEEWMSDSEEENVSQTKIEKKTAKPSFVKTDFVKLNNQTKTKETANK